jgi:hypothetical protein
VAYVLGRLSRDVGDDERSRLLVFTEVSSWPGQAAGQMLGGVARDAGCPPFGVAR